MMIHRKLKTLKDLKMKIMEELNLNPACYDIKIIYCYLQQVLHEWINYGYMAIKEDKHVKIMFNRIHKMPQINAAELYVSSMPLAEVDAEEVRQTTTSLQFTTLNDGCTTMGGHTMGGYTLSSQDYAVNIGETLQPQETHLREEDEDDDHAANNGENLDDMDEYEERIERGDFDKDVDDHELVPNFEEENMEYHAEGDANDDIGIQHDTNMTIAYTPPTESFYANTWENMVNPSHLQIPFVSTWEDGLHFSKGVTFANKEAVKCTLIIYVAKDNRNFTIRRSTKTKLCAACIDTNCKWYVGAFMKAKLNEIGGKLRQDHTAILINSRTSYILSMIISFLTIRDIAGTTLLHYVFWAFAPCIAAFRYCRPVNSIDGTRLYGKYRGVLMIAMATNANQKVLPLAFTVVDKESGPSWGWFLECLRISIRHVIPDEGICIAKWLRGDDGSLRALALKAGYATHEAKFESIMQTIKDVEIDALRRVDLDDDHLERYMPYTYLMSEDLDK
ncbi:hypothetical protein SO802_022343 [Lithocarpus litseifolius]|uniref:MULE transposase domain-containing protein n=1 Tax=Lithocarpus litseifolius TaxID=425828 RepID=A0AAW2CJD6_9ROSI